MTNKSISEDDLHTFEGWLRYQGLDPSMAPHELESWRDLFDEVTQRRLATPKVGRMKLQPGEHLYAVAVREGSDLWLTLWIRRSQKGEKGEVFRSDTEGRSRMAASRKLPL